MAFERLTKDARALIAAAPREQESVGGDGTVGAEHLLLALTADPALRDLGLDHDELVAALVREEEESLASVGLSADAWPPPALRRLSSPRLATSMKLALERALTTAVRRGERRITTRHLLLGVLAAEHGRVPRALALAEIDVPALRASL